MLVIAPHGATEKSVVASVVPERVVEADIQRRTVAGAVMVMFPASAGWE